MLIQPPHNYNGLSREPENFPLGLGYIARALQNMGVYVKVLDIWAMQYSNTEVVEKINASNFDLIGISALSTQYSYIKWLIEVLKKANSQCKIVLGGALPSHSAELVLQHTNVDVCVIGEGEETIKEIVENDDLANVKGICFKNKDGIVRTMPREYIANLDNIDFPAWDLFPIHIYLKPRRFYNQLKPLKPMNLITSRGCPYDCNFCSKTFTKTRLRSGENIAKEIEILKQRYKVNCLFFNDELFMISKKRVFDLCDKLEPLNIKFICNGRTNIADYELLKRMKDVGCIAIGYGVESGSQTILNNMNKHIRVEQSEQAIKATIKAKIYPIIYMMFGYIGENKETLTETVNFFKKIPFTEPIYLASTTPLPGSELYDTCLMRGLIPNEANYLMKVAGGYRINGSKLLVNLTRFTADEFHRIKKETENKILKEQMKKTPHLVAKYYLRYIIKRILH